MTLNDDDNYDFDINMDNFKDDMHMLSNKKFNINRDEINNNLKSKIYQKSEFMQRNARLKYDDELEMELFENLGKSINELNVKSIPG